MSPESIEEQHIRITTTCGKCGSKAIVSENGNSDPARHRIRALKCMICGNRQEQGVPCRWPFFQEETGNSSEGRENLHKVLDKGPDHNRHIAKAKQARRKGKAKPQAAEAWLSRSP